MRHPNPVVILLFLLLCTGCNNGNKTTKSQEENKIILDTIASKVANGIVVEENGLSPATVNVVGGDNQIPEKTTLNVLQTKEKIINIEQNGLSPEEAILTGSFLLKRHFPKANEYLMDLPQYKAQETEKSIFFYTNKKYGILVNEYEGEFDSSTENYYIFPKPLNTADEFSIAIKDTLFSVQTEKLNITDVTGISEVLENYIFLAIMSDASYPESLIIDLKKQELSYFSTHGDYIISEDEKFLIGWDDVVSEEGENIVCSEEHSMGYYVVTKQFTYELSTGITKETGVMGCAMVQ